MEIFILIGIILGIIILLVITAQIFYTLYPKNKLSKKLERIAEWIIENVHF